MTTALNYTDEQIEQAASRMAASVDAIRHLDVEGEFFGDLIASMLRSLGADRTRLQAEVEALREVDTAAQIAGVWLRNPPKPLHDMYRGNGRVSYASEAIQLAKAIDSARAKKGDV